MVSITVGLTPGWRPQFSSLSLISSGQEPDIETLIQETCLLFRNEDKQELPEANTERPETSVSVRTISTSGAGRNTGNLLQKEVDEEDDVKDEKRAEGEEQEQEDIVTRADLARIVSSHMQTIFRQLSDIDQRLNHIEDQWKLKKSKKI